MKKFGTTFILINGDSVISITSHSGKAVYKNTPLFDINRAVIVGTKI